MLFSKCMDNSSCSISTSQNSCTVQLKHFTLWWDWMTYMTLKLHYVVFRNTFLRKMIKNLSLLIFMNEMNKQTLLKGQPFYPVYVMFSVAGKCPQTFFTKYFTKY